MSNSYLHTILESQTLDPDGQEMKDLEQHRKDVEDLLTSKFKDGDPTITYGGSRAKGTMIKDAYDLDVICYFPHEDTSAGETLPDIYKNVKDALSDKYFVQPKPSALRLTSKDSATLATDFHIDVVPGRYVKGDDGDVYLHQEGSDKDRLKTNLEVHINHVKNSGFVDAIRLMKLWRFNEGLMIRHFALELLIIEELKGRKSHSLTSQLTHLWEAMRDNPDDLNIEDPANPEGNDLSELLNETVREQLSSAADRALANVEQDGWESLFGSVDGGDSNELAQAVAAAPVKARPYGA